MRVKSKESMSWNGEPTIIHQNDVAAMPQTINGSMIFAYQNLTPTNSDGELTLTSGGSATRACDAAAGTIAPTILVHNWAANNLKVTNTSNSDVPIGIQAFGPGMPGQSDHDLPLNEPTAVAMDGTLTGSATGGDMLLKLTCSSGALGLFAVIGGDKDASGNNAYVYAVNYAKGAVPPPGYTRVTPDNTMQMSFRWNTRVFVAFFGAGSVVTATLVDAPAQTATVTLLAQ